MLCLQGLEEELKGFGIELLGFEDLVKRGGDESLRIVEVGIIFVRSDKGFRSTDLLLLVFSASIVSHFGYDGFSLFPN